MASCGCAAQRRLWPPVALQPRAGYGLLCLCSLARAMASCVSAAQCGLWPPVSLQPSAGYGLLWLCSPARAMASCVSAVQRGLWPHITRFLDHTKRRATVGRTPLDKRSARRRDLYLTTHTTDKHPCPRWFRTHDRSRQAAVDLRLRPRGHWDRQSTSYTCQILIKL
jgi:hypothetical protein